MEAHNSAKGQETHMPSELTCPLCQAKLSHLTTSQAEHHVNGCLDVIVLEEKKSLVIHKKAVAAQRPNKPQADDHLQKPSIAESRTADKSPVVEFTDSTVGFNGIPIEGMLLEIEKTQLTPERKGPVDGYTFVYDDHSSTQDSQLELHRPQKALPAYKKIPGTSFTVDAFKYGHVDFCSAYFLTHFHSDHYGGLTRSFAGHIYCPRITANCVVNIIGVKPTYVHALPMNTRCIVHGVYVTLLDAEHCPGACIILFEIPDRQNGQDVTRIVHTGDFRASSRHISQIARVFGTCLETPLTPDMITSIQDGPGLSLNCDFAIDSVYLDTTYLEPKYSFPQQSRVVSVVGEFCRQINADPTYLPRFLQNVSPKKKQKTQPHSQITQWFRPVHSALASFAGTKSAPSKTASAKSRVLFVVGTYSIGKERLFIEIARQIGSKIHANAQKRRIIECISSSSLQSMLADDMLKAQVHAVPMSQVNMRGMTQHLEMLQKKGAPFTRIVAFSPTGWSHAGPYIPGPIEHEASPDTRPIPVAGSKLDNACGAGDAKLVAELFAQSARLHDGCDFGLEKLKPRGSSSCITIFPVPYSEHSSFAELARFICSLNIKQIIPTVFSGNDTKNTMANDWLRHWQELKAEYQKRAKELAGSPAESSCRLPHRPACPVTFCPNDPY